MQGQVSNLESEAQKRFKKDLAGINNQYIQANQYGSPQHMKSAESRAREISKATLEQRSKMLQDAMKSELSLGHQQQQANLKQTGLLGDQAQREYEDMLNKIRSTNNLGAIKFGNEQAENEDLYKNFQNEAAWEWPHLKGAIVKEARQGALGDVFKGLENRNVSLDQLAGLNTKYSESQKEAQAARRDLQTRDSTIADLQKQLGIFQTQQQKQQAQAAEAAKAAEEKAAKAQRLTILRTPKKQQAQPAGRSEALNVPFNPQSVFNNMTPIEQHAYRNYPTEAEFAAQQSAFTKSHFAGPNAGYMNRGDFPYRVPPTQLKAFWAGDPSSLQKNGYRFVNGQWVK